MREKRQHLRAELDIPVQVLISAARSESLGADVPASVSPVSAAALSVSPTSCNAPVGVPWMARARDISLGGMFIGCPERPRIGSEVSLKFQLPVLGDVELPGYVRWTNAQGFGVQFGSLGVRVTHVIGKIVRGSIPPTA